MFSSRRKVPTLQYVTAMAYSAVGAAIAAAPYVFDDVGRLATAMPVPNETQTLALASIHGMGLEAAFLGWIYGMSNMTREAFFGFSALSTACVIKDSLFIYGGRAGRLTKFLWASLVLNAMFAVSALYSASELPDKDTTTTTVMRTTTVDLAGKPLP